MHAYLASLEVNTTGLPVDRRSSHDLTRRNSRKRVNVGVGEVYTRTKTTMIGGKVEWQGAHTERRTDETDMGETGLIESCRIDREYWHVNGEYPCCMVTPGHGLISWVARRRGSGSYSGALP